LDMTRCRRSDSFIGTPIPPNTGDAVCPPARMLTATRGDGYGPPECASGRGLRAGRGNRRRDGRATGLLQCLQRLGERRDRNDFDLAADAPPCAIEVGAALIERGLRVVG